MKPPPSDLIRSRQLCNEGVHLTKHIRLVRLEYTMFRIGHTDHMRGRIAGLEGVGLFRCASKIIGDHGSPLCGIGPDLRAQGVRVSKNRQDRALDTLVDLYPFQDCDIASYPGRVWRS